MVRFFPMIAMIQPWRVNEFERFDFWNLDSWVYYFHGLLFGEKMKNLTFNYGYHKIFIVPINSKIWIGSTYSHVKMEGVKTKPRATCEQCIIELLRNIDEGNI